MRVCCVVVHRARQVVLVFECVQFSEYAARSLPIDGYAASLKVLANVANGA